MARLLGSTSPENVRSRLDALEPDGARAALHCTGEFHSFILFLSPVNSIYFFNNRFRPTCCDVQLQTFQKSSPPYKNKVSSWTMPTTAKSFFLPATIVFNLWEQQKCKRNIYWDILVYTNTVISPSFMCRTYRTPLCYKMTCNVKCTHKAGEVYDSVLVLLTRASHYRDVFL